MNGEQFAREWEKWHNLLRFALRVKDTGGERLCREKIEELKGMKVSS